MRKWIVVAAAVVAAAACEENYEEISAGPSNAFYADAQEQDASIVVTGARQQLGGFAAGQPAPAPPPPPAPAPPPADGSQQQGADALEQAGTLLAYRYGATLQLPARNVRSVMTAHEETCRAAGPAVCQILSANVSESGPDYVYGSLSLRAEPVWLATFREGLESDAEDAAGRVVNTTVTAEDLTRAIVDTDARLRAQRVLRERLERLLAAEQDQNIGDLLAVERELARVQGEIDSATSQLEVMRRRVSMSTLDLTYQPAPVVLSQSAATPLWLAVSDFLYVLSESAGNVVTFVAAAAPWLVLALPLLWLLGRWWRARRARKAAAPRTA